jgi:serine/threonine protein kinase
MSSQPTANNNPSEPALRQALQSAETLAFIEPAVSDALPAIVSEPRLATPAPGASTTASDGVSPSANSLVGQAFDDLELVQELGRGGMGLVYKARQVSLDRFVAVKLLVADQFQDSVRQARFQAEAKAAARLDHPNIVQIYQVGQCPIGHYYSMEYVEGESLETIIAKMTIPIVSAVAVVATLASAVHYAHTKDIVHRDLKPANVMIDLNKRPVIMDFGIVKFVGKSSALTQQGMIMGTPAFMAPEQAGESPEAVGPRSDVYSLGAILYNLLTGKLPFDDGSTLRTILKVIGPDLPPPIRSIRSDVPADLERICNKCMAKKPDDRFASALELVEHLRRFRVALGQKKADTDLRRRTPATTMRSTALVLTLVSKSGKEMRFTDGITVVGRSSDCKVVLKASDISKEHCRIAIGKGEAFIEDLGSANGIYVNNQKVRRAQLEEGDRLRIASHEFDVKVSNPDDRDE